MKCRTRGIVVGIGEKKIRNISYTPSHSRGSFPALTDEASNTAAADTIDMALIFDGRIL